MVVTYFEIQYLLTSTLSALALNRNHCLVFLGGGRVGRVLPVTFAGYGTTFFTSIAFTE